MGELVCFRCGCGFDGNETRGRGVCVDCQILEEEETELEAQDRNDAPRIAQEIEAARPPMSDLGASLFGGHKS